jgi:hypothetical protein
MMKTRAALLVLFALVSVYSGAAIHLSSNRGTLLILLLEAGGQAGTAVAMDVPSKWIVQTWNQYDPTYDFILALASRSDTGCKVSFTRYVMKDDYTPREEHFEAEFPYSQQARYPFFDYGYVIGFYRYSWYDFDHHELFFPQSSNQPLQPTAGRSDTQL